MSSAFTAINAVLVAGLIAGVITNGIIYDQTQSTVASINANLSNSSSSPFTVLFSAEATSRFLLFENVLLAYTGYQAITTPLGVKVLAGGAMLYQNGTTSYAKMIVSDIFPVPYLSQNGPAAIQSTCVNLSNDTDGKGTIIRMTVQPNGLDLLYELTIAPGMAPGNVICIIPIVIFEYPN
jgi:hypothetical protein